jgi:tetraprenyl-beta-curcumene synthase
VKGFEERSKRRAIAADRAVTPGALSALALANARYWPSTAPLVRRQLARWRARAEQIEQATLRELALRRLSEVGFNAEVAATLATLAPRGPRARVVEAIVALEIIFDFLDGITERPTGDPLADGRRLSRALTDAVAAGAPGDREYRLGRDYDDGGYLEELVRTVHGALRPLPALGVVGEAMRRAAARSAEAQVRAHAAAALGSEQVETWARREAAAYDVPWREYLAGAASSVVAVHALIAAAADRRTTHMEAEQLDRAYFSISALATMLDSLVDYEADSAASTLGVGYMRYYDADRESLALELVSTARRAAGLARDTRRRGHHLMTLVGIVAYYTTEPGAHGPFARPVVKRIHRELRPLIWPTLAVMRCWRRLKRVPVSRGAPPASGEAAGAGAGATANREHDGVAA